MNEHKSITGFLSAGISAKLKKSDKKVLGLIYSEHDCSAAAMFTRNTFRAAPIIISKEHLDKKPDAIRAIIVNSGNANACTGQQGIENARRMAEHTAKKLNLRSNQVLVASTGIIGLQLPMDKIFTGIDHVCEKKSAEGWSNFAKAIMTTDTQPKTASGSFSINDHTISILGIAKGAGMIHPNMATMIACIVTDAAITTDALQSALAASVERSFNSLSVDGDTSTNDTVFILANGAAGNKPIQPNSGESEIFTEQLTVVCRNLARQIALDGEGATKLIEVIVDGAVSDVDAKKIAEKIATSLLVKTALFGNDPNWGRIVCAIGNSGSAFDPNRVSVKIDEVFVFKNGIPAEFDAHNLSLHMSKKKEITITIILDEGRASARFWTCDISYDYVKINAHYHT